MYFYPKKDFQNGKVYLSIQAKVEEENKTVNKPVYSLGGFKPDQLEKAYSTLKAALTKINESLKLDEGTMKLRTGNEIKNCGTLYIKYALNSFFLAEFWEYESRHSQSEYDLRDLFFFLISSTIVDPDSIRSEVNHKGFFIDKFKFDLAPVYRFLDKIYEHCETLQALIFQSCEKLLPKAGKIRRVLYDGSNIFFEIKEADFDTKDEYNKVIEKALRTMGFSKENRPKPIVNIGLFVNITGDILGWNVFPGREREVSNILPELDRMIRDYPIHCLCFIADRGNYSGDIVHFLEHMHDYYIIGKSIRLSTKSLKDFALEAPRERVETTNRKGENIPITLASRIIDQKISYRAQDGQPDSEIVRQKQIVTFNTAYARRERHKRKEKMRRSQKLIHSPGQLNQKLQSGDLEYIGWENKEGQKPEKAKPVLNEAKALEKEKHDGQYVTVTNLLDSPDIEILRDYKLLIFAERDFRLLKSFLDLRPVYVWKREHIIAHIAVCIIALQVIRFLELRVNEDHVEGEHIFIPEEIILSLRTFLCYQIDKYHYHIPGDDPFIEKIARCTGVGLDHLNWSLQSIRKVFKWSSFGPSLRLF